ncbi:MAG: hypothetical protein ACRYGK_17225 [Janthinobacterium lividum]
MHSRNKISSLPRQASSRALPLNAFEAELPRFDMLETDSSAQQLAAVLHYLETLWNAARDATEVATQIRNLDILERRIKQDIDNMRQLLTRTESPKRQTISSLFSQRPQITQNAEQALAIAKSLCQTIKPYCTEKVWHLFDTLQRDLHKLALSSSFAASVADLDSLFEPVATYLPRPALPLRSPRSESMSASAESDDELDKLIKSCSGQGVLNVEQFTSINELEHLMPAPGLGLASDAEKAPSTAAPALPNPGQPLRHEASVNRQPASVPSEPVAITSPRARALSSPVLVNPQAPSFRQRKAPMDGVRTLRLSRSRQRLQAPASAPASPRNPAFASDRPSNSATPTREVVGLASAQLHWFSGTPAEFRELQKYNDGVLQFLGFSRFAKQPWKPEMVSLARALRISLQRLNEYFLVSNLMALNETDVARAHAFRLEAKFINLCAESTWTATEQVALFNARNLNWYCIKILGRALQSLTVRENLSPRAALGKTAKPPRYVERISIKPISFRLPQSVSRPTVSPANPALTPAALPAVPTQTLIRTRFSIRLPRQSGVQSAPVSPRQPQQDALAQSSVPSVPLPADVPSRPARQNVQPLSVKDKQ